MSGGLWGTFAGARVISTTVTIPWYGAWSADLVLAVVTTVPPSGAFTLGDLALTGFVQRTASFAGSRSARLVGGFGGWQKVVPAYGYSLPSGVMLSSVLRDVAAAVGEQVNVVNDAAIGSFFVREGAPAARVLRQLAGATWWIDPSGVTQVGPRANTAPITSAFDVIGWSGARGRFEIASEHLSDWTPGRTFSSPVVTAPQTISTVTIRANNEGIVRLDVLVTP